MRKLVQFTLALWAFGSIPAANAALVYAEAVLSSDQEAFVPPPSSTATGTASIVVDTVGQTIDISLSVAGIGLTDISFPSGPLGFGQLGPVHIHNAPAGANGQITVAFGDPGDYTDTSAGAASGFDLSSSGDMISAVSPIDFAAWLEELYAGNLYLNVHTLTYPGGEIRGQLVQVPEPLSLNLLLIGLAGMVMLRGLGQRPSIRPPG